MFIITQFGYLTRRSNEMWTLIEINDDAIRALVPEKTRLEKALKEGAEKISVYEDKRRNVFEWYSHNAHDMRNLVLNPNSSLYGYYDLEEVLASVAKAEAAMMGNIL
jgi:hypothetical protein